MDVMFHEKEIFYRSQTTDLSLQGENQEEVINLEELHAFFPRDSDFSCIQAIGSGTSGRPDKDFQTTEGAIENNSLSRIIFGRLKEEDRVIGEFSNDD